MNNSKQAEAKKMTALTLAFMAFSTVWGFGNVANGFVYFNGIQVIFSWIFMFALYFIPYALMVGELGSAFKSLGSGVSGWILETTGPRLAYYAGYTYWACHITYIAAKGSGSLKAISWAVFRNAETYDTFPAFYVQMATLGVFLLGALLASRGLNPLKKLTSLAGSSMFVMSILYIIMMLAAPEINPGAGFVELDFSTASLVPDFDLTYFTSLSILVFAVGGCEKISPYVNEVQEPARGFPRGIGLMAVMVVVCAILGTISMGMMFDVQEVNANRASYVANGAYWAFQKLGHYYGVGDFFMIIYALCSLIGQFAVLILSIDAPLRMLLDNEKTAGFIPSALRKQNDKGAYINGIKLVVVLSGSLILIQSFVPGAAAVLQQLTKLNSVCMPMRYLWVFVAYLALRQRLERFPAGYHFVKSQKLACFFGLWCFAVTAACCILGMYSEDSFTMALNICTPFVLCALGLIMPIVAKKEKNKV